MSAQRFACPHCGQHYATDVAWHEESMTCTACGSDFQPAAAPSFESENTGGDQPRKEEPAEPASVPASTASRERIRVPLAARSPSRGGKGPRLAAVAFGFFTPLLFLAAMASVAGVTAFFAIVAGPVAIYFLAPKLCEAVLVFGGPEVLRDYVASARVGFLVWTFGSLVAAFLMRGRIRWWSGIRDTGREVGAEYGLERYHVREGRGEPQGKLTVQAVVPASGRARLKQVFLDGVPYAEAIKGMMR